MKFRNEEIVKCGFHYADGTKYYIRTLHESGIPYSEVCSRRFRTIKEAKESIRYHDHCRDLEEAEELGLI